MIITPLNDYILIDVIKKANVTPAGILIPESEQVSEVQMVLAMVRAVGLGSTLESGARRKIDVKVGDLIDYPGGAPAFPYKGSELAEIDPSLQRCFVIHIGHIHSVITLEDGDKLRTPAEDVRKEKLAYEAFAGEVV